MNQLLENLFNELDPLFYQLNESIVNNIVKKIVDKLNNFIKNNSSKIFEILPSIINYISKSTPNKKVRKLIFNSIIITIMMLPNVSLSQIIDEFNSQNLDDQVDWNIVSGDGIKSEKMIVNFDFGQYIINDSDVEKIYSNLISQIDSNVIMITGDLIVSISDDVDNKDKKNYAVDDTEEQKSKGGQLIQKRVKSAEELIEKIKNKLEKDDINIKFEINIIEKEDGKFIKFTNLKKYKDLTKYKNDYYLDDKGLNKSFDKSKFDKPENGSVFDISGLSRNYQYVELLKLGGINAKRFDNDDVESGDKYTKWILNMRKSIKSFLTRLQKSYPEYNITFDKSAIAVNTAQGAMKGISNIPKQYTIKKESFITKFDKFINEKYKDTNVIFEKWNYIFGPSFPDLTMEQALLFDENIGLFLHYLDQIYGHSSIDFKYNKSYEENYITEKLNNNEISFKKTYNDNKLIGSYDIIDNNGADLGTFSIKKIGNIPIDPDCIFDEEILKQFGYDESKTFKNSIFLSGGFIINYAKHKQGIGTETINKIFEKFKVDNLFLYAVPWQGAIEFWNKIGGKNIVYLDNDKKSVYYIQINKNDFNEYYNKK